MRHAAATIDLPARTSGISVLHPSRVLRVIAALLFALLLTGQATGITAAQSTPAATAIASPVASAGVEAAIDWLVSQQDESGGFIGFSGEPDAGLTVDAILAIASSSDQHEEALAAATSYLMSVGLEFAMSGPAQAGKLVLAAIAVGIEPSNQTIGMGLDVILGSVPAADTLEEGQIGYCGFGPFDHAICTLALVAADAELPEGWLTPLIDSQIENGGWAFDGSAEVAMADSNTTAIVIQALNAAGVDASDPTITNGLAYLQSAIDPEQGGFAYDLNNNLIADANSTAIVIQALIATGEDAASDDWGRATEALAGFQNASGAFRYQHEFPDDNLYATVQAIPAMAGIAMPYIPN